MLTVSESINVWVFFSKNILRPHIFFWKGRRIKIETINLVHTSKEGSNLFYHFSVSAGGNFYRLKLDVAKMRWSLEEIDDNS